MSKWIRIASLSECPPGSARELVADDRVIALFNVEGDIYALDGICPHQGGPLGKGTVAGCIVTCPWHGWQFDIRTGLLQTTSSLRHTAFPTKVTGDQVYVDLDDRPAS
jgi:nitrite reductase (NADH) small subunit